MDSVDVELPPPLVSLLLAAPEYGVCLPHDQAADDIADAFSISTAGFRWVRTDLSWAHVEKRQGIYDWARYDALWLAAHHRGLRVLWVLDYGNALYPLVAASAGRAAFAAFARAAAEHFSAYPTQHAFEVWNEPNLPTGGAEAELSPESYVELLAETYAAVRSTSAAPVLGPAIGGATTDWLWWDRFFDAGGASHVDILSLHAYSAPDSLSLGDYCRRLRDRVREHGRPDLQLSITEFGTPAAEAADIEHLVDRAEDVHSILTFWYRWRDSLADPTFGLFTFSRTPKPAYFAALRRLNE